MKFVSLTLIFSALFVGNLPEVSARLLGKDEDNEINVEPFDAGADPLVMDIATNKGCSVQFFEPSDGAIVVTATFDADDKTNPIKDFQAQSDQDTDFGAFFEWLTGEKPKGRMKAALMRHEKMKKAKKDAPRDDSIPAQFGEHEEKTPPDRRDPFHRELDIPASGTGSRKWWCERGCNSYRDLDWGTCIFGYNYGLQQWRWGEHMFVEAYPYDGGEFYHIRATIAHVCTGCSLVTLADNYIWGGQHILIWAGAGTGWYRGQTLPYSYTEYHASFYELTSGYSWCLDPSYPGFGCSWWGDCPVTD